MTDKEKELQAAYGLSDEQMEQLRILADMLGDDLDGVYAMFWDYHNIRIDFDDLKECYGGSE